MNIVLKNHNHVISLICHLQNRKLVIDVLSEHCQTPISDTFKGNREGLVQKLYIRSYRRSFCRGKNALQGLSKFSTIKSYRKSRWVGLFVKSREKLLFRKFHAKHIYFNFCMILPKIPGIPSFYPSCI